VLQFGLDLTEQHRQKNGVTHLTHRLDWQALPIQRDVPLTQVQGFRVDFQRPGKRSAFPPNRTCPEIEQGKPANAARISRHIQPAVRSKCKRLFDNAEFECAITCDQGALPRCWSNRVVCISKLDDQGCATDLASLRRQHFKMTFGPGDHAKPEHTNHAAHPRNNAARYAHFFVAKKWTLGRSPDDQLQLIGVFFRPTAPKRPQ